MSINFENRIPYEVFEKWIYQDHNIYLNYSSFSITIATCLIYLDDIEFVDNLQYQNNTGNLINNNNRIYFIIFYLIIIYFFNRNIKENRK